MGGANTGTNKIGQAQLAAGTVPKATRATAADLAAFDKQQAQNQRIASALQFFGDRISSMDFNSPMSQAYESQSQADAYKRWQEMQRENDNDGLNFIPMMPFTIRSSRPELVSNAWGNAGKDVASGLLSAVGTMYGRR